MEAERFAVSAQMRLLSSLPDDVLGRVRVVACAHTTLEVCVFGW